MIWLAACKSSLKPIGLLVRGAVIFCSSLELKTVLPVTSNFLTTILAVKSLGRLMGGRLLGVGRSSAGGGNVGI